MYLEYVHSYGAKTFRFFDRLNIKIEKNCKYMFCTLIKNEHFLLRNFFSDGDKEV